MECIQSLSKQASQCGKLIQTCLRLSCPGKRGIMVLCASAIRVVRRSLPQRPCNKRIQLRKGVSVSIC